MKAVHFLFFIRTDVNKNIKAWYSSRIENIVVNLLVASRKKRGSYKKYKVKPCKHVSNCETHTDIQTQLRTIKTRAAPISRVRDIDNLRWLLLTQDDLKWLKTTLNDLKRHKMTEMTTLTYLT